MKNLLLIMTDFYGYNNKIIEELNNQGWNVHWINDGYKPNNFERIIGKINRNYLQKKFNYTFHKKLQSFSEIKFDLVLIIFGANYIKDGNIGEIRKYCKCPIVYYAWDSVANFKNIKKLFELCDKSYTFDDGDSKLYGIEFLPLFYVDNVISNKTVKYDVSTVMTFFSEKSGHLSEILANIPEKKKTFYYLRISNFLYYIKILMFNKDIYKKFHKYFSFKPLKLAEAKNIIEISKIIIDCPLPQQNGLTMRTFETLAKGKKLITTNQNIKKYPFYSPNNIFVVDGKDSIPNDFWESDFDYSFSLGEEYSLKNFVKKLTDRGDL